MVGFSPAEEIRAYYGSLLRAWGPQHWWPAQSRFEVIVGAYLTQNTSWTNVEKALANLRRASVLTPARIHAIPIQDLEGLVRSAGYFRQKASRLKQFVEFLYSRYGGSLSRMFAAPTEQLRQELLSLNGVGPETADSILLYAGNHSVFVVDAYARRILARHGLIDPPARYDDVRLLIEGALRDMPEEPLGEANFENRRESKNNSLHEPASNKVGSFSLAHKPSRMSRSRRSEAVNRYNEMHGLIVVAGKLHCHKQEPDCARCPLAPYLSRAGPVPDLKVRIPASVAARRSRGRIMK